MGADEDNYINPQMVKMNRMSDPRRYIYRREVTRTRGTGCLLKDKVFYT